MNPQEVLEALLRGQSLDAASAESVMQAILSGECPPPWVAGFLVALRRKGETTEEIAGFARAMRRASTAVPCSSDGLVDTCGTGGDSTGSFNISTTAAFVVAGGGGHVAKHGNRSVSSQCGSADVLEALGARLELGPAEVGACVDEIGFGFLFAPALHGAMRHAVEARRALGVRTVFNILGPLTNPAGARRQLIGVFDASLLDDLSSVLQLLDTERALLVHGDDGLDELTVCAGNRAILVEGGRSRPLEIDAESLGLRRHASADLRGGDARENAKILRSVLGGEGGARRDITLLNAGAALWVAGLASRLDDGIELAARSIDEGRAREALERYVDRSQEKTA